MRKKAPMDANAIGKIWRERRFSEKPFLAYLAEKDGAGGWRKACCKEA
jgi:hypothetical protein